MKIFSGKQKLKSVYRPKGPLKILVKNELQEERKCTKKEDLFTISLTFQRKKNWENQDGGVGRHTAPPRTTRTDRESNSKGDQHQENRK